MNLCSIVILASLRIQVSDFDCAVAPVNTEQCCSPVESVSIVTVVRCVVDLLTYFDGVFKQRLTSPTIVVVDSFLIPISQDVFFPLGSFWSLSMNPKSFSK